MYVVKMMHNDMDVVGMQGTDSYHRTLHLREDDMTVISTKNLSYK